MGSSKLDILYRNFVFSKFFVKGWGNPTNIQRLFEFRKIVKNREQCQGLVDSNHPVTIVKEEDCKTYTLLQGYFKSPLAIHLPGLVPKVSENAHFEILLPKQWKWANNLKPMVVQYAGTGDHYFWRRRMLMGKPLIDEYNIGSIILENPFYGLRKPEEQHRSCLNNVSDIFVMGGCLILESLVLFHWCQRNGLGPLGATGVSMGGYMASLAATSWPKPLVLVPCLSWSTASSVFTQGVLSRAIDWPLLESQYCDNQIYNEILQMISQSSNIGSAFDAGRYFAQNYSCSQKLPESLFEEPSSHHESLKNRGQWPWQNLSLPFKDAQVKSGERVKAREQAIQFMRGIMDEFTHIANYSRPVDCSSIVIVAARDDAYVPRNGTTNLGQLWPESEIRYVKTGHIGAYVLHHSLFRRAVKDAFDRLILKH